MTPANKGHRYEAFLGSASVRGSTDPECVRHLDNPFARKTKPIGERLAALKPHQRHKHFSYPGSTDGYQSCRFCQRSWRELGALWKYGVRHWICDDCRDARLPTEHH